MPQGKAKQQVVLKKARQDRVIKHEIKQATPAEVKEGKDAIDDRIKGKLHPSNYDEGVTRE